MQHNDSKSIHLTNFPSFESIPYDNILVQQMDIVRDICSTALAIRKECNLKTKTPIASMVVYSNTKHGLHEFGNILQDEINAKEVIFSEEFQQAASETVVLNFKICGNKLGKNVQLVNNMIKNGQYSLNNEELVVGEHKLDKGDFFLVLKPTNENFKICHNKNFVVYLDTQQTKELIQEGIAREIIRKIQTMRKEMGCNLSDRISIHLSTENPELLATIDRIDLMEQINHHTLSETENAISKNTNCTIGSLTLEDLGEVQIWAIKK